MLANTKVLLAKSWKNESADLPVGRHEVNETLLREAITEAMTDGRKEDAAVLRRIEDVEAAIKAVKTDLIATLPKMPRNGKIDTSRLTVQVLCLSSEDEPLGVEAA